MAQPRRIIINSGPTLNGSVQQLPPMTFAEIGVSTDQNFLMVGTGTSNPHQIQTTHSTAIIDYSDTPGVVQNRYLANPMSTPLAPAYQTNKVTGSTPSGICEPSDGDVGIVVKGVLIGRFTSTGLQLSGNLQYSGGLGGVILSFGTTAQRPATPQHGFIWHNTSLDILEWWDGSTWRTAGSGGSGTGLSPWEFVTTTYTAQAGERIDANTDGGAFTITFPAAPVAGDEIWIIGDFLTRNLTINPNGKKIARKAEDFVLNEDNIGAHFVYNAVLGSWRIVP